MELLHINNVMVDLLNKADFKQRSLIGNFIKLGMSDIKKYPMGISRYEYVNGLIDECYKNYREKYGDDRNISCRKGCAHCCYIPVHITKSEAKVLEKHITPEVSKQMNRQVKINNVSKFMNLKKKHRACGFLKDNICTAYESRPFNCKLYEVVSDPELCDSDFSKQVVQSTILHAYLVQAAFIQVETLEDNKKLYYMAERFRRDGLLLTEV